MARKTIRELTSHAGLADTDIIPISTEDTDLATKESLSNISDLILGSNKEASFESIDINSTVASIDSLGAIAGLSIDINSATAVINSDGDAAVTSIDVNSLASIDATGALSAADGAFTVSSVGVTNITTSLECDSFNVAGTASISGAGAIVGTSLSAPDLNIGAGNFVVTSDGHLTSNGNLTSAGVVSGDELNIGDGNLYVGTGGDLTATSYIVGASLNTTGNVVGDGALFNSLIVDGGDVDLRGDVKNTDPGDTISVTSHVSSTKTITAVQPYFEGRVTHNMTLAPYTITNLSYNFKTEVGGLTENLGFITVPTTGIYAVYIKIVLQKSVNVWAQWDEFRVDVIGAATPNTRWNRMLVEHLFYLTHSAGVGAPDYAPAIAETLLVNVDSEPDRSFVIRGLVNSATSKLIWGTATAANFPYSVVCVYKVV